MWFFLQYTVVTQNYDELAFDKLASKDIPLLTILDTYN